MNTLWVSAFSTLMKREWLEHRAGFFGGPLVVLAILVLAAALVAALGDTMHFSVEADAMAGQNVERVHVEDRSVHQFIQSMLVIGGQSDDWVSIQVDRLLHAVAAPFYVVLSFVSFFVLLGVLYDDRKDRTVLFWKSMPVSDSQAVVSKIVFVTWVAPVVTIAVILVTQLFFLAIAGWIVETGQGGRVWANSGILMSPVELLVGYAVHGLWVLPVFAWLLLVSSAVSRTPFMWAIGVPVVPIFLEWAVFGSGHLARSVGSHINALALPRAGGNEDGQAVPAVALGDTLGMLASGDLWLGVLVGAALVAGAVYFRQRNNEI